MGIQISATTRIRTTAPFGIHSLTRDPVTRSLSHLAEAPPGVFSTSNAKPAQTNDIARVTTMSGTRVMTTTPPLMAPRTSPSRSTPRTIATANSSDWPFMSEAETTLVRAITAPIDRSIPPEMTTIA